MTQKRKKAGGDSRIDWALSTLQSPRTCELLLKAHYQGGCARGRECPVVISLLKRMKQLRAR